MTRAEIDAELQFRRENVCMTCSVRFDTHCDRCRTEYDSLMAARDALDAADAEAADKAKEWSW